MNESAAAAVQPAAEASAGGVRVLPRTRDGWLYLGLAVLIGACWAFTRLRLYDTKSDIAYWLGVAGGVGMLLLLSYPLRKHVRFMHRWGAAKGWFAAHMILGVSGAVLILLHSNFELGSVNASVVFFSMAIVALSGVVGRFLFLRLHRNLNGEKLTLGQMRAQLDHENTTSARLRFAPKVVERCREFERLAIDRRIGTGIEVLRAVAVLPWLRWRAARFCHAEARRKLVAVAHTEGWTRRKLNARVHTAGLLIDEYLQAAHRVALFAAWERLFSWWHVAHVPFVYLLVISAIVHVIAVHAYELLARWARRLALALALMACGVAQAQSIESVLQPGPVIEGHAKTEHECKACHLRFDRNAQDNLCIACHKEVGQDVRAGTGWHGKREQKQALCRSCHSEHKGRNFKAAAFDQKTFDHKLTDFELLDKHAKVDCAKCHVAGKRWREAALTCDGCHRKDDVHKGSLGAKCEDCHTAKDWKTTTRFDHDKTRFALTGKHIDAKCDACHVDKRYKDTPRTCIGCHRKDDDEKGHKGQYGEKCESCHGTKAWKPAQFNHDTDTRYPLKEKHRQVKCSACHTTPLFAKKTGKECIDCHLKDDKHKETLGRQCANCHTERSWKEPLGFDHQKTKFPLRGKHVDTKCKECHEDTTKFKGAPTRCIDCHKKDDKHGGTLGDKCEQCHGEQNWKTLLPGSFDHDKTKFPLRNAHAARTVKCTDCHESARHFKNTPTACFSCHKRDDRHEATLGEKCEQCHGDSNWRVPRFDHNKTRYPLLGGHQVVACKACHQSLRYREAPRDCYGCHRKDDRHKAAFGPQCETCHNVRAWTLWDFDHDRGTRFRLDGKHKRITCEACHAQPAPPGRKSAPVGSDCLACHRKDDVHEGAFGRRCEQCHDSENWKRLKQGARR